MAEKLKPCPFCGGPAIIMPPLHGSRGGPGPYKAICNRCDAMVVRFIRVGAVEAWNRRPTDEEPTPTEPTE